MKKTWIALFLIAGLVPKLNAQDIHASPLVWLNPDDAPDELPVARGLPDLDVSEDLKAVHEPAYKEFRLLVTAKGETGAWETATTSPWLKIEFHEPYHAFIPAKRVGQAVASEVSLFFIYNPAEASLSAADSIPRLLTIQPPINPTSKTGETATKCTVRVRASIDSIGVVTAAKSISDTDKIFNDAAVDAVRGWTFAPARKGGQAIAAELDLNVVFLSPVAHDITEALKPKPIKLSAPTYPRGLAQAGIIGQVTIDFIVSVEGRITEAIAIKSTNPGFEDAALKAMKEWRFKPATKDGRIVATHCTQEIVFNLEGDDSLAFKITPPKTFPPNFPEQMRFEVPPRLESMEMPVYPLEDLLAKRGGKVSLAYVVGPDGKVQEVSVMSGAPSASLAAAAAAALETFKFTPPGRQGKPCFAMLRIELEFSPGGNMGHAPVTEGTQRILHLLEKSPEKLTKARNLDRKPELRSGTPPTLGPTSSGHGDALIELIVDRDGIPRLPHIVSASEPAIGYCAIQAVSSWRFSRPRAAGKFVDATVRVPFVFK